MTLYVGSEDDFIDPSSCVVFTLIVPLESGEAVETRRVFTTLQRGDNSNHEICFGGQCFRTCSNAREWLAHGFRLASASARANVEFQALTMTSGRLQFRSDLCICEVEWFSKSKWASFAKSPTAVKSASVLVIV